MSQWNLQCQMSLKETDNHISSARITLWYASCKNITTYPVQTSHVPGKCKAVPLQAWSGPEGSWKLRFPDFMTTAQDGGKVVSLSHRPPLPPGNAPDTHSC